MAERPPSEPTMLCVGAALCILSLAIMAALLRWVLPDWVAGLAVMTGGAGLMFGVLGWDAE